MKFWGSPWQPWFYDWAFNLNRGHDIKQKWDLIEHDVDVLITHGPPYGILDKTIHEQTHVGCEELKKCVLRLKPKLHVFGHIHEGYGTYRMGDTVFINACILNVHYQPVNKPIIVELINGIVHATTQS